MKTGNCFICGPVTGVNNQVVQSCKASDDTKGQSQNGFCKSAPEMSVGNRLVRIKIVSQIIRIHSNCNIVAIGIRGIILLHGGGNVFRNF